MSGYGPAYLLLHAVGWGFSLLLPDRQVPCAIIGAQSVGKDTLHKSIDSKFRPVYADRIPTTVKDSKIRSKVHLENAPHAFRDYRDTQWFRQNYPHYAEEVREQIRTLRAELVFWIVSGDPQDLHNWQHDYNWRIIEEAVLEFQSAEESEWKMGVNYKGRMVAKKTRRGRKCRYLILVVNKMDLWDTDKRASQAKKIINSYLSNRSPAMSWLRTNPHAPKLLYMVASFQDGNYLPFHGLDSAPQPLSALFEDLIKLLVKK